MTSSFSNKQLIRWLNTDQINTDEISLYFSNASHGNFMAHVQKQGFVLQYIYFYEIYYYVFILIEFSVSLVISGQLKHNFTLIYWTGMKADQCFENFRSHCTCQSNTESPAPWIIQEALMQWLHWLAPSLITYIYPLMFVLQDGQQKKSWWEILIQEKGFKMTHGKSAIRCSVSIIHLETLSCQ